MDAPDIDVVSVAIANELHRPVVEALLAAGKHVLCEKPLAPSVEDAKAMVAAAEAGRHAVRGRLLVPPHARHQRDPRPAREAAQSARSRHFNGHYWCDYAQNPNNPISWRYQGGPGTGALADIGSHMIDLGEYLCGPIASVSGAVFQTFTTERPVPLGATVGHAAGAVGDAKEPVENEDIATFTATFASGAVGTFSIAASPTACPTGSASRSSPSDGAAAFDLNRPGEFIFADDGPGGMTNGYRSVLVGPQHPGLTKGIPMDFPSVGHGQNDLFAWQARAFLNQVAGIGQLPPLPSFAHGLHNMEIQAAVTQSALNNGQAVTLA